MNYNKILTTALKILTDLSSLITYIRDDIQ